MIPKWLAILAALDLVALCVLGYMTYCNHRVRIWLDKIRPLINTPVDRYDTVEPRIKEMFAIVEKWERRRDFPLKATGISRLMKEPKP